MDTNKSRLAIAVYGKGGIGKSTVSANLSAALALSGKKVMQIGCDPKHDSTRLLMHGENIPTVLDYLKDREKSQAVLEDVLRIGWMDIACVEAGGPKPGVGCAGRGIITAFEFLKEHRATQNYDTIVYDVLGDVVCGGFAVPVRKEYANAIYLVTSGEYMALYAANNILRGIRNYDGDTGRRVAGIIYNERKLPDEDERVKRFAKAVGLPICAKVPRSEAFAKAEQEKCTLMELEGCHAEHVVFLDLAHQINRGLELYSACPLEDEELEQAVLGTWEPSDGGLGKEETAIRETQERNDVNTQCRKTSGCKEKSVQGSVSAVSPDIKRPPLYGCAFNGAATCAIHLTDAVVIAHSPKACAFYTWQNISSPGRKNLFTRGILMPTAVTPKFECTEMGPAEVVFGGMDLLRNQIRKVMERKPGAVIVISSCVSGIIGDDIREVENLSTPEVPVITLHTDGDIAGDYMEGIRMCMYTLGERLIDPNVKPAGKKVNLINETGVSNNRDTNYHIVKNMLEQMGIEINCRFLGDASCREMKHFMEAKINILASDDAQGRELKQWLSSKYECQFMEEALPVGFQETKRWLLKLGEIFSVREQAEKMIAEEEQNYLEEIEKLKPYLGGKRIFITTINANIDWILDTAKAIGMEVLQIGVINYLHQDVKVTEHPEEYEIIEDFDWSTIHKTVRALQPDLVLSNYTSDGKENGYVADTLPMSPAVGFQSGIYVAKRWAKLLEQNRKGAWMNDRALFEKYYS